MTTACIKLYIKYVHFVRNIGYSIFDVTENTFINLKFRIFIGLDPILSYYHLCIQPSWKNKAE
jgi:hypothetical protein